MNRSGVNVICMLIITICMILVACAKNDTGQEQEQSSEFAQDFEYKELVTSCDKSELAQTMVDFDSGDPAYKRVTWQYDDEGKRSIDYIMEIYPIEQADAIIESTGSLYEKNADEFAWVAGDSGDKRFIALYNPSDTFPEGVTMRVYFLSYGDNLYVLSFEQRYLLNGVYGVIMSTDCNSIIRDTVKLLKGE